MGWIRLHRNIQDHWIFQDPVKFHRWVTLLILARHDKEPYKINIGNKLYVCNRGQHITSLQKLSDMWKCTRSSAKHFLELLQKDDMITLELHTVCTQITICNYDTYQPPTNSLQTDVKQLLNTCETDGNTNKNDKNDKNDKNVNDNENTDINEGEISHFTKQQKKELKKGFIPGGPKQKEIIDFAGIIKEMVERNEMQQKTANSILEWVEYKKLKKTLYTTEIGFRKFITVLKSTSKESKRTPTELIDYAISKEWDGIHVIKEMITQKQPFQPEAPKPLKSEYADNSVIPADLREKWGIK